MRSGRSGRKVGMGRNRKEREGEEWEEGRE